MGKTPFIQTMKRLGQAPSMKNKVWATDITTIVKSKNGLNRSSSVPPIPLPYVATQPTERSMSVPPNPSNSSVEGKRSLGNNGSGGYHGRSSTPRSTTISAVSMGSSDDANAKAPTIADFGSNNASKKKRKPTTSEVMAMATSISKPTEQKKRGADNVSNEKNGGSKPTSIDFGSDKASKKKRKPTSSEAMATSISKPTEPKKRGADDESDFGSMWKSTSSEAMVTSISKPTEPKKRGGWLRNRGANNASNEKNAELIPTSSTTSVQNASKMKKSESKLQKSKKVALVDNTSANINDDLHDDSSASSDDEDDSSDEDYKLGDGNGFDQSTKRQCHNDK